MTTVNVMALAVTAVLYVSVYGVTWRDRYMARLTLACALALVLAVAIQAPLQGICIVRNLRVSYQGRDRFYSVYNSLNQCMLFTTSYRLAAMIARDFQANPRHLQLRVRDLAPTIKQRRQAPLLGRVLMVKHSKILPKWP